MRRKAYKSIKETVKTPALLKRASTKNKKNPKARKALSAEDKYIKLLRSYISQKGEGRLDAAMEMGRALAQMDIPLDAIKGLHEKAVVNLSADAKTIDELEATNLILAPFQELLAAYCMAFREQLEARRHELQLKEYSEQLEAVNRSLESANQELEDFAYVASHDLRAPLRAINNLSLWIEEDLGKSIEGDVKKNMGLLRSRVSRMGNMIDDLLEFSRTGRLKVAPEKVDCGKLINEVIDLLSPPDGFNVTVSGEMPVLKTAKSPLQQVFSNLIGNAIKHHGSDKGRIAVSFSESEKTFTFIVSDDGQGIPVEYHEQVFGMFKRLKSRDEVEGSGMGLALIKKIVTSAGGDIALSSAKGKGCTFTVMWPKLWE